MQFTVLNSISPQESVNCPKLYPTSRRNPLSTITEDKSPSVTDISSQDLSQMVSHLFFNVEDRC